MIYLHKAALVVVLTLMSFRAYPRAGSKVRRLQSRYPVVIHHGFAGKNFGGEIWGKLPDNLRAYGHKVYTTNVSPFAPIKKRGRELQTWVDDVFTQTNAKKVIIIGYSMGGLDARYLASKLKYGDRIAALVTIGSPHRGTMWCDFGSPFISIINQLRPKALSGVHDLTRRKMKRFNKETPDHPEVVYQSWAGSMGIKKDTIQSLSLPLVSMATKLMNWIEGANDGIVSVESAKWGLFNGAKPTDHLGLIGQGYTRFDHESFFLEILQKVHQSLDSSEKSSPIAP